MIDISEERYNSYWFHRYRFNYSFFKDLGVLTVLHTETCTQCFRQRFESFKFIAG
jgi:copper oxidase (laccase) domain-containing protein